MQQQQQLPPTPTPTPTPPLLLVAKNTDLYIKMMPLTSELEKLSVGLTQPVQDEDGYWKTEVFIFSEKNPSVHLFSTFVYSLDKWFEPSSCVHENVECTLPYTKCYLNYNPIYTEWRKHSGYFDNFSVVYSHEDDDERSPCSREFEISSLFDFSTTATTHRSLYRGKHMLFNMKGGKIGRMILSACHTSIEF